MTATLATDAVHAHHRANPARRLPVGARFPRWTLADELAFLTAGGAVRSVPVFPVGARFRKRTPEQLAARRAERLTAGSPPRILRRPVGARFPRRVGG